MSGALGMLLQPLEYEFMQRALLACVLIGFTNGFLGAYVILRRLSLMADALSHSLLPGVAAAAMLFGLTTIALLFGGLLAALLVALGGWAISRSSRLKDETAIAALYILAFAAGVTMIRYARVKIDLVHFLFGNVLGIGDTTLWLILLITAITVPTLLICQRSLLASLFEPAIAKSLGIPVAALQALLLALIVLALIASIQAVGVLLSLGLLILPAATMVLMVDSLAVVAWGGGILGMAGASLGLMLSYWFDIPSGPAMVLVLGTAFLGAYLLSPRYGFLARFRKRPHLQEASLRRWER